MLISGVAHGSRQAPRGWSEAGAGKVLHVSETLPRRKCLCQFLYCSVHRRAEHMQHVDTLSRPHEPRAGDESATEQLSAVSAAEPELSSSGVFSGRGSADPPPPAVGDSVPETADRISNRIRIADQFRPVLPAGVGLWADGTGAAAVSRSLAGTAEPRHTTKVVPSSSTVPSTVPDPTTNSPM